MNPGEIQQGPFNERLTILGTLGVGGMGAVYRAYDSVLSRDVALKVIRPEILSSSKELQRAHARFQREAQVMARIRHPAIVGVHDVGVSDKGAPYLVMEYVEGRTLADLASEQPGTLDPQRVMAWCRDLAEGLQACHDGGVVHRDVKPSNIMIDGQGMAYLTDFGIALDGQAHTKLTQSVAALGTLSYMPPEQAAGKPADGRADVYSLGATLHETLTGQPLFTAASVIEMLAQIVKQPPSSSRTLRPELPADLDAVILKCLEKEPGDRYGSAAELALDLDRLVRGQRVAARPAGHPALVRLRAWARHNTALVAALVIGALLLCGVVGGGLAYLQHLEDEQAGRRAAALNDDPPAEDPPPPPPVEPPLDDGPASILVKQPGLDEWVNPKDGMVFVWVEPATFDMGSDPSYRMQMEQPLHQVTITKGYFIAKHEVTWKQLRAFCAATGADVPSNRVMAAVALVAEEDHPAFNVSYDLAEAYCSWAGVRLPTEAEWELAARGPRSLIFPWGNDFPPGGDPVANIADVSGIPLEIADLDRNGGSYKDYDDGVPFLAPVDSFEAGASPCGALHMSGNISEWVAGHWSSYTADAKVDPGPRPGERRVARGGAWSNSWWAARTSVRFNWSGKGARNCGFRVAYSPPAEDE